MKSPKSVLCLILSAGWLFPGQAARAQESTSIFQKVPSPNTFRHGDNNLYAVAASAPDDVWAVGLSAIHYDGTSWTAFSVPGETGEFGNQMTAVADLSPTDAWATGPQGRILHWDGTSWSLNATPQGPYSLYGAVAAISANDIWAGLCVEPGFEHYDGTQWSYVAGAGASGVETCIEGISALASNDVWAVGYNQDGDDVDTTLIQHWDGTAWTAVASPNLGKGSNQLYGVVALADDDVWAAGSASEGANTLDDTKTLIEHWDGTSWSVVPSPSRKLSGSSSVLQGVVAVSANDIWAFGWEDTEQDQADGINTLLLHWDGTSWSLAPCPNPHPDPNLIVNQLMGGVMTAPGTIWLVGFQEQRQVAEGEGTLVLYTAGG